MTAAIQRPAALAIVVPTYNERDRLTDLVDAIFSTLCSRRHRRRARHRRRQLAGRNRRAGGRAGAAAIASPCCTAPASSGLGTAVIEGFAAASAPVVGVIDADLSHPPELLPRHVRGHAVRPRRTSSIGSRYIPGGGTQRLGSRAPADVAVRMPAGSRGDAGSRRDLRVLPDPPRPRARCADLGGRIQDLPRAAGPQAGRPRSWKCPYVFVGRTAGESKMNTKEALGYLKQLVELRQFARLSQVAQTHRRLSPQDSHRSGRSRPNAAAPR